MDLTGAFDLGVLTIVGVFVFVDLFDRAGTLIGVGQQGGFVKHGRLSRVNRVLMPDAVATTAGAVLGHLQLPVTLKALRELPKAGVLG